MIFVHETRLGHARQRLERFVAKAEKIGVEFGYEIRPVTAFERDEVTNAIQICAGYTVALEAPLPRIEGKILIATATDEAGALIAEPTRKAFEVEHRDAIEAMNIGHCDHCNHDRRRKTTYLFQDLETLEYFQIGSTCARDYFRGEDSTAALGSLRWEYQIERGFERDEERGHGPRFEPFVSLPDFLRTALAVMEARGAFKSAAFGEDSTAMEAWAACNPPFIGKAYEYWKERFSAIVARADAPEIADQARAIIASYDRPAATSFDTMVQRVIEAGTVTAATASKAAGTLPGFKRELDAKIRREKAKAEREAIADTNAHIASEGDRVELTIVSAPMVREFEGRYGTFYIVKMIDDQGRVVLFKGGYNAFLEELFDKRSQDGLEARISIAATIKSHDDYNDELQTVIARPKVKEVA